VTERVVPRDAQREEHPNRIVPLLLTERVPGEDPHPMARPAPRTDAAARVRIAATPRRERIG